MTRPGGSVVVAWRWTADDATRVGSSDAVERSADDRTRAGGGDVVVWAMGSGQYDKDLVFSSRGRLAADDARRAGGGRRDKGRRKDSTTNLPSCGG